MIKILDNSSVSSMGRDIKSIDLLSIIKDEYDVRLTQSVIKEYSNYHGNMSSLSISGMDCAVERDETYESIEKVVSGSDIRLGPGEISVMVSSIILASNGIENYVIIDERLGRKIFHKLLNKSEIVEFIGSNVGKIHLVGTIGVVKHMRDKGILSMDQSRSIADDLQRCSFRVSEELLDLIR